MAAGAALEGEGQYPPYMSFKIQWPKGVETGAPMQREHDTLLFKACMDELVGPELAAGQQQLSEAIVPGAKREASGSVPLERAAKR